MKIKFDKGKSNKINRAQHYKNQQNGRRLHRSFHRNPRLNALNLSLIPLRKRESIIIGLKQFKCSDNDNDCICQFETNQVTIPMIYTIRS